MAEDNISHWVKKAKDGSSAQHHNGVNVIRRAEPKTKGEMIMDIADRIWPSMMKLFADTRDENGVLMQPAHVRGIALNVAQDLLKNKDAQLKKSQA